MLVRILALLCGLLLGATPAAAADWQTFTSPEYGLATSMPGSPRVTVDGTPANPNADGQDALTALVVVTDTQVYLLQASLYGTDPSINARDLLNYTVDQVSTPERGPVAYRAETTVQGFPAIDVVFGPDADGAYIRDRVIARNGILVQLITTDVSLPPVDRFYTDFKFVP